MPLGGYAIEAHGLDELKEGLRGSRGGLRDLRRAYAHIAETAGHHVRARAPIGSASAKDGAGHLPPGYLKASVRWGATINGPWVSAGADPEFPLTLQEFGGTSFWQEDRGSRAYFLTACALGARRDWSALDALAADWCASEPGNPEAWMALGRARLGLGRAEAAAAAFQNVVRLDASHDDAVWELQKLEFDLDRNLLHP